MAEKRAPHQRARDAAQERVIQTARTARERGSAIKTAALDMPWARCAPARLARETILSGFFGPVMAWYVRRRIEGREVFAGERPPVVFVANHSSHMDTPAILRALPRAWRQRTAVAAAADYFYRKRWVAAAVSLLFSTVPISRKGGGMEKGAADHLHRLIRQRWNLLLYPEGTRSRDGSRGKLHPGAAGPALGRGGPRRRPRLRHPADLRRRHRRGDAAGRELAQALPRRPLLPAADLRALRPADPPAPRRAPQRDDGSRPGLVRRPGGHRAGRRAHRPAHGAVSRRAGSHGRRGLGLEAGPPLQPERPLLTGRVHVRAAR